MRSLQLPRGREGLRHELDRCQCPTYVTALPAIGINDLAHVDFNQFDFLILRYDYVARGHTNSDRILCCATKYVKNSKVVR
jgi:hypothetical protein